MKFSTVFFDLDDTLYPHSSGIWPVIRENMTKYMEERLQIPGSQIEALRQSYYERFGTTLRGLQEDFLIDSDDFLRFVHQVPVDTLLKPNQELKTLLQAIPQRKWIFTNADRQHAKNVLKALNLKENFDGIIDIVSMEFHPKPDSLSYKSALKIAGETDPRKCVLIDDNIRNLIPAANLGFFTVLVGSDNKQQNDVSKSIRSISELGTLIPILLENKNTDHPFVSKILE